MQIRSDHDGRTGRPERQSVCDHGPRDRVGAAPSRRSAPPGCEERRRRHPGPAVRQRQRDAASAERERRAEPQPGRARASRLATAAGTSGRGLSHDGSRRAPAHPVQDEKQDQRLDMLTPTRKELSRLRSKWCAAWISARKHAGDIHSHMRRRWRARCRVHEASGRTEGPARRCSRRPKNEDQAAALDKEFAVLSPSTRPLPRLRTPTADRPSIGTS